MPIDVAAFVKGSINGSIRPSFVSLCLFGCALLQANNVAGLLSQAPKELDMRRHLEGALKKTSGGPLKY